MFSLKTIARQHRNKAILLLSAFLISACTTSQKTPVAKEDQQIHIWSGKGQIRIIKKNKTLPFAFEAYGSRSNESFRIDLSGPMGVDVASFVAVKNQFRSVSFQEKKTYQGRLDSQALRNTFKVDMEFSQLLDLFYNQSENKRTLKTKDFLMVIVMKNYETKDQLSSNPFQIEFPEGYQNIIFR